MSGTPWPVARPLIGLALSWTWVLTLRFLDRTGKGLRTAPRDALISAAVTAQSRGRAFGFHRAMDHTGAIIGPLVAFLFLQSHFDLRHVFELSLIPGTAVLLLVTVGLDPAPHRGAPAAAPQRVARRGLILSAAGLALAAVPEAFLVLWAQAGGIAVVWVPLLWAASHTAKMLVSLPGGALSDRLGWVPVLMIGWTVRIVVLLSIAVAPDRLAVVLLFMAYGAALAWTEGAERALIGDFAPATQKATAHGLYYLGTGLMALPGARAPPPRGDDPQALVW